MSESLSEVEYLRRDNKRLRQQCSAEGKTKYAERLKDGLRRAEQRELEACAEADELRTDAERYEKLKHYLENTPLETVYAFVRQLSTDPRCKGRFNDTVDALPEVEK